MEDYWNTIREVESRICNELESQLKLVGGISNEDEREIEFFNYDSMGEVGLTQIDRDGYIRGGDFNNQKFRRVLNNGDIDIAEAISLVNELRPLV